VPGRLRLRAAAALIAALTGTAAIGAETGASIYRDGKGDGPAIQVRLGDGTLRFPATSFRCASCHGLDGAGRREGGNLVPPVTGAALAVPRPNSSERPSRPAYDDTLLARAVIDGVDAAGRPLSAAMPRFALSAPQTAALIGYLKGLGRDDAQVPGVSATVIRVGTALPLSGPRAATGQAVRQLLAAVFAREDATGIYGRRLELVVADSAAGGAGAALARLVAEEQVFALVATELPADPAVLDQEIPVIGDLDGAGRPLSRSVFRLAVPIADRVAALLRQAERCDGPNLPVAVIGSADAAGRGALAEPMRAAIRVVLDWHDLARPAAAVAAAVAAGSRVILVLAPRDALAALRAAMLADGVTLPLLVPGQPDDDALAGAAVALAPSVREPVRLAFAGLAPEQIDDAEFRAAAASLAGGPLRSLLLYEAYASAVVLLEAVKAAGRRIDRAALLAALAALRDVRTGVLPPIGFGPDRRQGLGGAAVVGFAADGSARFLAPWQSAETLSHRQAGCRAAAKAPGTVDAAVPPAATAAAQ